MTTFGGTFSLGAAAVVGGADVIFTNNGPLSGVTHTAGTATVVVPVTGTYRVDYTVNYTAGVGAALAIAVNGTVDASTNRDLLTAIGSISGENLLPLTAGDVITLRNNSAIPITLDSAPGVGASLVLMLLN